MARRKSSTRFDYTRRNTTLIVLGGAVLLIAVLAVIALLVGRPTERHNLDVRPRNLDIWAVYPDDSVRFITLFYPDESVEPASPLVDAAGPLIRSEDDVLSSAVFGGELAGVQVYPGAEFYGGTDSSAEIYYQSFSIHYTPGSAPYGVDVRSSNSPYLVANPLNEGSRTRLLTLGTSTQPGFAQVIVAVALPTGTDAEQAGLQPYRTRRIGDWDVYYYDTSQPEQGATVTVDFKALANVEPGEIDFMAIDRQR